MTEPVVLLDEHGSGIGSELKAAVHNRHTPLHLGFSCYLVDRTGRVLLTRRALAKRTWPGVWTNSCCGHPMPGEAIVDAVRRRLDYELGIWVERVDLILPAFRYCAVMSNGTVENEICPVFRAWAARAVAPNRLEVAEARWYPWQEVAATVVRGGDGIAPWFRLQALELDKLGNDPRVWPTGDSAHLPAAARYRNTP